jgi:hypothetical protein
MDDIARAILPGMPVLIVAGAEGGTGLAGAVELNTFLARSDVPRFNVIVVEDGPDPDIGREAMAVALLSGMMHPGTIVKGEMVGYLRKVLDMLSFASVPGPGIRIPLEAWVRLRQGKGPYDLEVHTIPVDGIASFTDGKGPSLRGLSMTAIEAPGSVPASDLKRTLEYMLGFGENISVGVTEGDGPDITTVAVYEPVNPGPMPSPGSVPDLEELLGMDEIGQIIPKGEQLH